MREEVISQDEVISHEDAISQDDAISQEDAGSHEEQERYISRLVGVDTPSGVFIDYDYDEKDRLCCIRYSTGKRLDLIYTGWASV